MQAAGRGARSLSGIRALLRLFLMISFFSGGSLFLQAQGPSTPVTSGRTSDAIATGREKEAKDILSCRTSWVDFQGVPCTISYFVPVGALERAERNFGFVRSEFEEHSLRLETALKRARELSPRSVLSRIVEASPYRESFSIQENDQGEIVLELIRPVAHPAVQREYERIKEGFERQWAPISKKIKMLLKSHLEEYLEERCLRLSERGIGVRYRELVGASRADLKPLADELRATSGSRSWKTLLGTVLSFVQEIPWTEIALEDTGRYTAGLAVPLRVLADNRGDCDSKAVLFAALWTNLSKYRLILVTLPGHMIVGAAVPRPEGAVLEWNGTSYLLLEVCVEGKIAPGKISAYSEKCIMEGSFRCELVW